MMIDTSNVIWCSSFVWQEFYIVQSGFSTDDAIEIIDENRGHLFVKEIVSIYDENDESIATIEHEPEQGPSIR
jgi:hypothetical protein